MTKDIALFQFTGLGDKAVSSQGWHVDRLAIVNTLDGNDIVQGSLRGFYDSGINNEGIIISGLGDDTVKGVGGQIGVRNSGEINTGSGNDNIIGFGQSHGIYNGKGYGININTGAGNDIIKGTGSTGIFNLGGIITGGGNDIITGITNKYGFNIVNTGVIDTGGGNDTVDASSAGSPGFKGDGFSGGGKVYLGRGQDTLMGFGAGEFFGGYGIDKLLFKKESTYDISGPTIVFSETSSVMSVYQFERIGGVNGGLFAFRDGTLTVNAAGVGTFA